MSRETIHLNVEPNLDDTGVIVLNLSGKLDSRSSAELLDLIESLVTRGERYIVLNCVDLERMNSSGLEALLRARARLKRDEVDLSIAGAKGIVAEVLRITRLDRVFELFPTVHHAIDSLQTA